MNLTIVGTGYVGLVTGVCFAEFGYSVTCIDKDTERLKNSNQVSVHFSNLEWMSF